MATPYENHATLNHNLSRHSPNGVDIIEECNDCAMRWLHNPTVGYPVTLRPLSQAERIDPKRFLPLDGIGK